MKTDNRIMTGFPSLDKMLGGLRPGTLTVIAGMPGVGKSALALNIAVNCAKDGNKVGIFSLEMSKDVITHRIVKYVGNTSVDVSELPIYYDDEAVISPSIILDKVNKQKVDIIIVDYLELITLFPNKDVGRAVELESITRAMKSTAVELNTPIVLLSQVSRPVFEWADPTFYDACYMKSWFKEYADSIIYVYSRYFRYLWQSLADACFSVVKNDSGETGTINVKFDKRRLSFLEMDNVDSGFHTYEVRGDNLKADLFLLMNSETLFKSIDGSCCSKNGFDCADNDYLWFITYEGIAPKDNRDFDPKKTLAVSVFEKNHGWKLVGVYKRIIGKDERNREENNETRRKVRVALKEHIRYLMDASVGWAELVWGSKLEKLFAKACTIHEIIDPYDIQEKKLYPQVDVNPYSEFHYACQYNPNGENTWRIAYGYIEWNKQGEV